MSRPTRPRTLGHGPAGLYSSPPNRIDLLNGIDGVAFEEAWPGRVEAVIETDAGDVPIAFIGLDALVKNKRSSGRWWVL